MARYSLNMKIIIPKLKTSNFYFVNLNKDDNSLVTYWLGVLSAIEKPTE